MDVFLFLVLLNGAVLVGVLCLIVRGVCVCGGCGDACRVGRSVVAGLVVRFGIGVVSSVSSSGGVARGIPIAAWCGILGVNNTTLLPFTFLFNTVNCNDLKMAKHGRNM
jgi:hypothetical protein